MTFCGFKTLKLYIRARIHNDVAFKQTRTAIVGLRATLQLELHLSMSFVMKRKLPHYIAKLVCVFAFGVLTKVTQLVSLPLEY